MSSPFARAAVGLGAASLLLVACGSGGDGDSGDSGGSGDSSTSLTLTFSTTQPSFDWGLIGGVAKGAGFFEDEGLDVDLETASGGSAAVQSLVAGQSDVVTTVPSDVMAANQTGGADVKCFDANTTGFNLFPAVPPDSDIETYGDLAGKNVAVTSPATSTIPIMKAMAAREGADPNAITFLPIPPGATAAKALEDGQVDALGYWDTQYSIMKGLGIDLRPVEPAEGVDGPTFALCYAATTEWLEKNPDQAEAFGRAVARAYVFIKTNPEAAARITLDMYPELQSSAGGLEEAVEAGVLQITGRLPFLEPVDGKIGYVTDAQVDNAIQLQVEAGLIKTGLAADDIWTDQFVEEFNKIDQAAVEEQAENYEE